MNTLINLEEDAPIVKALNIEESFALGTDIANLEQEEITLFKDMSAVDYAIDTVGELSANTEDSEAYRFAMSNIALGLGLTADSLTTESKVTDFMKMTFQATRKAIIKINALAKKLWLKMMAWIVSSDKKRDELVKSLEELKSLTLENEDKLLPIVKTRAAFLAIEQELIGPKNGFHAVNSLRNGITEITKGQKVHTFSIMEDRQALGAMKSKTTWSDVFTPPAGKKLIQAKVIRTNGNDVQFLISLGDATGASHKVVTRTVKKIEDNDVMPMFYNEYGKDVIATVTAELKELSTAKEIQSHINEAFKALDDAEKLSRDAEKDMQNWLGVKTTNSDTADSLKLLNSELVALSKTTFGIVSESISVYRFWFKMAEKLSGFEKK